MKCLKDQNNVIATFPKYVLIYSNFYEAIAYLLRDILYELSIKINKTNRLIVAGLFQDVFDTINPSVDNIFSSFDINEEYQGFTILFFYEKDVFEKTGLLIKEAIRVDYKE